MENLNWRWRFIHFLRVKIAKTPDECISPKWIKIFYCILFPLNWLYERQSHIRYDPLTGKFNLMGVEITRYDIVKLKIQKEISSRGIKV